MSATLTVPIPGLTETVLRRARVALGNSKYRLLPIDKAHYVKQIADMTPDDRAAFAPSRIRDLAETYPRGSADLTVWAAYQAKLEAPETAEAIEDWAKSLVHHVMRHDR